MVGHLANDERDVTINNLGARIAEVNRKLHEICAAQGARCG